MESPRRPASTSAGRALRPILRPSFPALPAAAKRNGGDAPPSPQRPPTATADADAELAESLPPLRRRTITWDEDTIALHNLDRGTRMRIAEPKTPFPNGGRGASPSASLSEPDSDEEAEASAASSAPPIPRWLRGPDGTLPDTAGALLLPEDVLWPIQAAAAELDGKRQYAASTSSVSGNTSTNNYSSRSSSNSGGTSSSRDKVSGVSGVDQSNFENNEKRTDDDEGCVSFPSCLGLPGGAPGPKLGGGIAAVGVGSLSSADASAELYGRLESLVEHRARRPNLDAGDAPGDEGTFIRRREFERKRKAHYNEFRMLKEMRNSSTFTDEDEDEDGKEGKAEEQAPPSAS
eukprot:GHVT01059921.1.p1 GENE.GHVT01059921.1~~GHVT01059921.1.p1  ORF type:complete len:348 (-),score=107.76 GHVT01059921.1:485-1528(-)